MALNASQTRFRVIRWYKVWTSETQSLGLTEVA